MSVSVNVERVVLRYGFTLVVLGLAVYVLSELADPAQVAANLSRARLFPYIAAIVFFYLTFPIRAIRWGVLLDGVDVKSDLRSSNIMILLNWFLNTLLPAKAGDLHRSYLASENYQTSKAQVFGTIAAERTIDLTVLTTGLLVTMAVLLPRFAPTHRRIVWAGVGLLAILGSTVFAIIYLNTGFLPTAVHEILQNFRSGLTAIPSVRRLGLILGITVVMWSLNIVRMSLVAHSVGFDIQLPMLVLVALLVAFLSGLPYTPAGVGVVEVVTTSVLIEAGSTGSAGLSFILFDRLITVGSLVIVGSAVYLFLKFTGRLLDLSE